MKQFFYFWKKSRLIHRSKDRKLSLKMSVNLDGWSGRRLKSRLFSVETSVTQLPRDTVRPVICNARLARQAQRTPMSGAYCILYSAEQHMTMNPALGRSLFIRKDRKYWQPVYYFFTRILSGSTVKIVRNSRFIFGLSINYFWTPK